jgi:hypothetical protein
MSEVAPRRRGRAGKSCKLWRCATRRSVQLLDHLLRVGEHGAGWRRSSRRRSGSSAPGEECWLPPTYAEPPADLAHARFAGGMAVVGRRRSAVRRRGSAARAGGLGGARRGSSASSSQRFQANYRGVELEAPHEVGLVVA